MPLEDRSRTARRGQRVVVFSEANKTLQRAVQRPCHVHFPSGAPKELYRRVVLFQGVGVPAAEEAHVTDGSQALRAAAIVVEFAGQPFCRERQAFSPLQVDSRQPDDAGVQVFDDSRLPELLMSAKKCRAVAGGVEFRQPIDQLVLPDFSAPRHHLRSPPFQACAGDASDNGRG